MRDRHGGFHFRLTSCPLRLRRRQQSPGEKCSDHKLLRVVNHGLLILLLLRVG